MVRVWCLLIGYAFGLIQTAFIYGKLNGIDIRTEGSGNAGTTNTLRVLGRRAGLIVLVGDILKTAAAICVVRLLFVPSYPELKYLLVWYAGAGAILGHNFPFYMKFKGGKGIAATAGLVISFDPWFTLAGVIAFFVPFLITKYVSLGSLCIYPVFLIEMIVLGQFGYFDGASQAALIEMYVLTFLLMGLAYYQHRGNIVKLINGTERKTYLGKKPEDK